MYTLGLLTFVEKDKYAVYRFIFITYIYGYRNLS